MNPSAPTLTERPRPADDVAALSRWYRCPDCEVSWHDATTVCWSCDRDVSVLSHDPVRSKDAVRTAGPAGETALAAGTPLTRFGPHVDPVLGATRDAA